MPSPGLDPVGDASGGLEAADARGPRWFGATRPGAVSTLVVLALVVLLFQRQLLDDRQRGARGRAHNVPGVPDAEPRNGASRAGASSLSGDASMKAPEQRIARPSDDLVVGRLVDPRGRSIAGAEVRIGQQSTRTGEDGRFVLPWAGGDLQVTHPGFWSRELKRSSLVLLRELDRFDRSSVPLAPGSSAGAGHLPLLLVPGVRVTGSVGVEGTPVEGARVLISSGQRRWEVLTDPGGRFSSPLLPAASLSLLVLHHGTLPYLSVLAAGTGAWDHRVEVALERGEALGVRVESDRGKPVGDAEVWLRTVRNEGDGGAAPAAVEWEFVGWTGDLGRVDAARANHRPAQIQVRTPGYEVTVRPLIGPESLVRLRPAPSLTGTAVDAETGLPVDLRSVRLHVSRDGEFVDCPDNGQQSHTLGGGQFIVGLPPFEGLYRVSLRGEGNRAGVSDPVRFDGSEAPAPLLVPVERRTVIAGCLRRDGAPTPGAAVELLSMPDADAPWRELHGVRVPPEPRVARRVTTDQEGRFEFGDQGPGLYRARVRLDGQGEYCSPTFCPPLDEELPIELGRGSTLSGVLLSSGGIAAAGVPLVLTDGEAVTRITWTDQAGSYEFRDLPAGGFRLGIGHPRDRLVRGAVETRELTITEGVDLRFNMRRRAMPQLGGATGF